MTQDNPWVDRFDPEMSDVQLIAQAKIDAVPLTGLGKEPKDVALRHLRHGLDNVFVPTPQVCNALRMLICVAYGHALARYPSRMTFIRDAHQEEIPLFPLVPICFSGLAGVGKTQLLLALTRIFPPNTQVTIAEHGTFPLVSHWHITIKAADTLATLLRQLPNCNTNNDRRGAAIRQLYLRGTCIILLDELQFLSQGAESNVSVAKLLMQLSTLGVPVVYGANFSLLHRLMRRPQEECQRLLVEPFTLHPEAQDSEGWLCTLKEKLRVAPEFRDLDPQAISGLIYDYTFAINRAITFLLSIAYGISREANAKLVTIEHIKRAYISVQYSTFRRDVEILIEQAITGTSPSDRRRMRQDLWCPLASRSFSIDVENARKAAHEQKVADANTTAMLSPNAKGALRALGLATAAANDSRPIKAARRPPPTRAALLQGAVDFENSLGKPGKRKEPR